MRSQTNKQTEQKKKTTVDAAKQIRTHTHEHKQTREKEEEEKKTQNNLINILHKLRQFHDKIVKLFTKFARFSHNFQMNMCYYGKMRCIWAVFFLFFRWFGWKSKFAPFEFERKILKATQIHAEDVSVC